MIRYIGINVMNEPVSSATLGEKIVSTTVATGGLSLPLWIQYFQQYTQVVITTCYLIVAIIALIKSIRSLKKNDKKTKK